MPNRLNNAPREGQINNASRREEWVNDAPRREERVTDAPRREERANNVKRFLLFLQVKPVKEGRNRAEWWRVRKGGFELFMVSEKT